jgi:hypothetical protein
MVCSCKHDIMMRVGTRTVLKHSIDEAAQCDEALV